MTQNLPPDARARIIAAAASLIRAHGPDAATTRAVAAAASVQPPTIYRLVGDKDALLDAVAELELAAYVATKQHDAHPADPVEALRQGWNKHVAFGLANPAVFRIMASNPRSPAAAAGLRVLGQRIHAIALAGRLRGSEERAVAMVHAAGTGVVMALIAQDQAPASFDLGAETREAVIRATTTTVDFSDDTASSAATTLRARLGHSRALSPGERGLLDELLLRLSDQS